MNLYYVTVTFKFCFKLAWSSVETIWMIKKHFRIIWKWCQDKILILIHQAWLTIHWKWSLFSKCLGYTWVIVKLLSESFYEKSEHLKMLNVWRLQSKEIIILIMRLHRWWAILNILFVHSSHLVQNSLTKHFIAQVYQYKLIPSLLLSLKRRR